MSGDYRFQLAASVLAQTIYASVFDAYGKPQQHWCALTPETRKMYELQAEDIIRANRPVETASPLFNATAAMARRDSLKVLVGVIRPEIPWGEKL